MDPVRLYVALGWMLTGVAGLAAVSGWHPAGTPAAQTVPASVRENPGSSRLVFIHYSRPVVRTYSSTSSSGGYSSGK